MRRKKYIYVYIDYPAVAVKDFFLKPGKYRTLSCSLEQTQRHAHIILQPRKTFKAQLHST